MGSKRQPPVNWVHLPPTTLGPDEELEPWELETVDEELATLIGQQIAEQLDARVAQYVSSAPPRAFAQYVAPECACGHLLPSHRADGCKAVVLRDRLCGCVEWRPR
jgi:hypothetical protein